MRIRYVGALSLVVAASLIGLASLPESAKAQSNPYALDRLFLAQSQKQPLYEVLSFGDATEVENYYGVGTEEARLATEFFKGCDACGANMLFTRLPILSARAHLVGGNVTNLAQFVNYKKRLTVDYFSRLQLLHPVDKSFRRDKFQKRSSCHPERVE